MKNLLLTVLCSLLVSFSFGQDKKVQGKPELKQNSVKAVEYLALNLKLDAKQRVIVMNAFAEYANNMKKAIQKTSKVENADPNKVDRKAIHKYMMRFTAKRDELAKDCLKKKQLAKYDDFVRDIHPFTLEVRVRPKKKK